MVAVTALNGKEHSSQDIGHCHWRNCSWTESFLSFLLSTATTSPQFQLNCTVRVWERMSGRKQFLSFFLSCFLPCFRFGVRVLVPRLLLTLRLGLRSLLCSSSVLLVLHCSAQFQFHFQLICCWRKKTKDGRRHSVAR